MKRFWRAFNFLEDILAGGLLFIGVTVIFYGVIMRYFLMTLNLGWMRSRSG